MAGNRKPLYEDVKRNALKAGGFSAFEASASEYSASLFTRLCRDPELEIDKSMGYPWTGVRLRACGLPESDIQESMKP